MQLTLFFTVIFFPWKGSKVELGGEHCTTALKFELGEEHCIITLKVESEWSSEPRHFKGPARCLSILRVELCGEP